ncbi:PIR protein [Plasmodium sp.]|nr:PIR protein [Plasmodium sp.]
MKSVKENFDRQASQRFEEYEERMITQRKKYKEQRDKDIQEIIIKDKIDKSLEEKVEKGCLKCGCGLGGVAASVGIFGSIAVSEVKKAALVAAAQKGIDAGINVAIKKLGNIVGLSEFKLIDWAAKINETNFLKQNELITIVNQVNNMCNDVEPAKETLFCQATKAIGKKSSMLDVQTISEQAAEAAVEAGEAAKNAEKAQIALVNAESTHLYNAIGYSVLAILIILLVMVIIYLILRYRRNKKMNKKQQYTKLLNQ